MPSTETDYINVTPVILDYQDLIDPTISLDESLKEAFGPSGLGVCLVKGIPEYESKRERLLLFSSVLADLDKETLDEITHDDSFYQFGWSHGKEIMNGRKDLAKGSFYNNPTYDAINESEDYRKQFPQYGYPNLYPSENKLPGLRNAFEDLGHLVVDVAQLLAKKCDNYLEKSFTDVPKNLLTNAISNSKTVKSRLLHYFPSNLIDSNSNSNEQMDSWCGRHIDHSLLTGLTAAMYQDDFIKNEILYDILNQNKIITLNDKLNAIKKSNISLKDFNNNENYKKSLIESGLYICPRQNLDKNDNDLTNKYCKIDIPNDMLAFQIGEAAEISSRGLFVATPHLVKGSISVNDNNIQISRNTCACFIQPNVNVELKPNYTFQQFTDEVIQRHY